MAAGRFRQSDISRAVLAMGKAGVAVGRIEIEADGRIVLYPESDAPRPKGQTVEELNKPDWRSTSLLYNPDLARAHTATKRKRGTYGASTEQVPALLQDLADSGKKKR